MAAVLCSVPASSCPGCCREELYRLTVSMGCLPQPPRGPLRSPFLGTEQYPNEFRFTKLRIAIPPDSLVANHELSNRKYTSVHLPFSIPVPIRSTFSCFHFPLLGESYQILSVRCCYPKYIPRPTYPPSLHYCGNTRRIRLFTISGRIGLALLFWCPLLSVGV
jgi:hypothetical protein